MPPPEPRRGPPVPLIFDTDMSIDVDDVGALCVAHALADAGEAELVAVVHNTGLPQGVGGVSVLNHYYGRDDVPMVWRGGRATSLVGTRRRSDFKNIADEFMDEFSTLIRRSPFYNAHEMPIAALDATPPARTRS